MSWIAHPILADSTVAVAPAPALTGLSLTVNAGDGALFGSAFPFYCIAWPTGLPAHKSNAEVFSITGRAGDVLTIGARAQQGTTARAIIVGDQIAAVMTPKDFTDLENATLSGTEALAQNDTSKAITFTPNFAAAPRIIPVLHSPDGLDFISCCVDLTTRAVGGATIRFAAAIPAVGWELDWIAHRAP